MRTLFALALLLLSSPASFTAREPVWEEIPSMPEGRSGMIVFRTNESEPAYLGGSSWDDGEKRIHASGYVFRDEHWHPLSPLPMPIAYASVASGPNFLAISGGTDGEIINSKLIIQKPNLPSKTFALPSPHARIYAGAAYLDGAFYQIGGSTQLSPLAPTDSISKRANEDWTDLGALPEGPLINPAVAVWRDKIYVFGGGIQNENGFRNTGSVYSFDTIHASWTKRAPLPTAIRGGVATPVPGLGLLLIGGYAGPQRFSGQAYLYVPEEDAFTPVAELPVGLMLPGVVLAESHVYVFGGEDAPESRSPRAFRANLPRLLNLR